MGFEFELNTLGILNYQGALFFRVDGMEDLEFSLIRALLLPGKRQDFDTEASRGERHSAGNCGPEERLPCRRRSE
jgi:hypothetical protein